MRQADDLTLVGNLAGSLAYQWSNNGREREAVDMAQAAGDEAGPDAAPAARALFLGSGGVDRGHRRALGKLKRRCELGVKRTMLSAQGGPQALGEPHGA
ncbi:hypothetical protein [Streptomyces sp. NPDC058308]|uniref:hypothetical protein n=1 Tax=Streptomyces sp. NPDC058308 TaxID=3346440 RepID=UPI0036EF5B1D